MAAIGASGSGWRRGRPAGLNDRLAGPVRQPASCSLRAGPAGTGPPADAGRRGSPVGRWGPGSQRVKPPGEGGGACGRGIADLEGHWRHLALALDLQRAAFPERMGRSETGGRARMEVRWRKGRGGGARRAEGDPAVTESLRLGVSGGRRQGG